MRQNYLETLAALPEWSLPDRLPNGWIRGKMLAFQGPETFDAAAFHGPGGLLVIVSAAPEVHEDGRRWAHASASKKGQLPNWQELKVIKDLFFGPTRLVMQILPPQDEYVNVMPTCLHLWHCIDDPSIVPAAARG